MFDLIRRRMELYRLTPASLLGMVFLFVIIVIWFYAYAPLLLGIRGLDEAMFIIGQNSRTFFSPWAIGESFLGFLPGVFMCAVYSFFFLDVRKFLLLIVVVLAVPKFLTGLTTLGISNIQFKDFNSLFIVSQFLAMSFPFLLFERFSFGKYRSWREYFSSRTDFSNRLAVMKKSARELVKQLAIVLLLAVIGYIPFIITEEFSFDFLAVYFIETGVVFFFSFYIVAGFVILFADKKTGSKGLFATIFLLLAGMIPVVLMIPLVIGLILSPVFSLFGGGALRAAVAYAPGTTYLLSFYFLHLFLYSGTGGMVSLALFLSSIVYVSSASLREFDFPKPDITKPACVSMALVIGLFAWLFFPAPGSSGGIRLTADEVFRVDLPSETVQSAGRLMIDNDMFVIFDTAAHRVVFMDRKTWKADKTISLLDAEGKFVRNAVVITAGMVKNGKDLVISAVMKDTKKNTEYAAFYRFDGSVESATPVARSELEKKSSLVLMTRRDGNVIALFNSRTKGELSAFSVKENRLLWKSGELGDGAMPRYEEREGVIFKTGEDVHVSFHMSSMKRAIIQAPERRGMLMMFSPANGAYSLLDPVSGDVTRNGKNICELGGDACPGGADSVLSTVYSLGSAGGDVKEILHKLRTGFIIDEGSLFCAERKNLYAFNLSDGAVLWKKSLADSRNYRNRFYSHTEGILHIKDYGYKDIVTALVIDGKTGDIIGRWSLRGYDLVDLAFDADGTCVFSLMPAERGKNAMLVGIKFREL